MQPTHHMKNVLKYGKRTKFVSKRGGGLSGEVYFVKNRKKRYVVRSCASLEKAKFYERLSHLFDKKYFLPQFLTRQGSEVLYEYIGGRQTRKKNESLAVIEQIGVVAAYINQVPARGAMDKRFYNQLHELATGQFMLNKKQTNASRRAGLSSLEKIAPILSADEARTIRKVYQYLKKMTKPRLVLDINDLQETNFRVRDGKVYLVDIEGIKTRVRGFGIAKGFMKWFKEPKEQRAFLRGYSRVASTAFYTSLYKDFLDLNFLLQIINYRWKLSGWKIGLESYEKNRALLNAIIKRHAGNK